MTARSIPCCTGSSPSAGSFVRAARSLSLDPGTFWLLKTVTTHEPMRVTELAGLVNLDPSTVSRHVAQLERSGLIERTPDPDDGRAQLVTVSGEGRQKLEAAFARRRELLARSLAEWAPEDVDQFEHLLGKFARSLESTAPPREEPSV